MRVFRTAVLGCFALLITSCGSALKLHSTEVPLSENPVGWDQIVEERGMTLEPSPEYPLETEVPPEDIARMAPRLGGNHVLAEIALRRSIRNPVLLDQGVYGKVGSATFFAAPIKKVPTYDRLYWSMMKVLSERYGCFIIRKETLGNKVRFRCRDKRTVVMWRGKQEQFLQFYARQYDDQGRELIVSGHKVMARR
jgi:hypothetical protein